MEEWEPSVEERWELWAATMCMYLGNQILMLVVQFFPAGVSASPLCDCCRHGAWGGPSSPRTLSPTCLYQHREHFPALKWLRLVLEGMQCQPIAYCASLGDAGEFHSAAKSKPHHLLLVMACHT